MDEKPWEPAPIPAAVFHQLGQQATINRAPYDRVSGVLYKRAGNIKRVQYTPADAAPEAPEPWRGYGTTLVRWLFSEQAGTAEQLLPEAQFEFLHDTTLLPGSATGQQAHVQVDEIFYVLEGQGTLYHRPNYGSPVIARPLRPGDAVLVRGGELHNLANDGEKSLRLLVLGLRRPSPKGSLQ